MVTEQVRLGLLVPSTNASVERDCANAHVLGISVHSARLRVPAIPMSEELLDGMNQHAESALETLRDVRPHVIAYCCTSGSFYKGPAWDADYSQACSARVGIPFLTTSQCVTLALRALDVRRVSVFTPYPDWTNERLVTYLAGVGCEVAEIHGDPRASVGGWERINDHPPQEILSFVAGHLGKKCDAIFCSCTAWQSMTIAQELENRFGLPVITSNQATLWAMLQAVDFQSPVVGYGRLFQARLDRDGVASSVTRKISGNTVAA